LWGFARPINFYRPEKSWDICKLKVFFETFGLAYEMFYIGSAYPVAKRSNQTRKHLLRDIGQFRLGYFAECYYVENL